MTKIKKTISDIIGKNNWIDGKDAQKYYRDWLNINGTIPMGVAFPANTNDVSEIVKVCSRENIEIIPQGGNTGLVGASVPSQGKSIIISFEKMHKIIKLDVDSGLMVVEAGIILADVHAALNETNFEFPMHLGSEGSARIGGLVATNAGGNQAFRFGMMTDLVLGLEVVLPDGQVFDGVREVQKDNSGYQLRSLFCGSEGTLGLITKVVLKLVPKSTTVETGLVGFNDLNTAVKFCRDFSCQFHNFLMAIEFFTDFGVDLILKLSIDNDFPVKDRASIYVLFELGATSSLLDIRKPLIDYLSSNLVSSELVDCIVASSESQRRKIWFFREEQPEGQRLIGEQIKNDISVPIGSIEEFITRAIEICFEENPNLRINYFGHMGDGNIHFNISPPEGNAAFTEKERGLSQKIAALANEMNGSFAAEHGIGRTKKVIYNELRGEAERDLRLKIKKSIDNKNIFNKGVIN